MHCLLSLSCLVRVTARTFFFVVLTYLIVFGWCRIGDCQGFSGFSCWTVGCCSLVFGKYSGNLDSFFRYFGVLTATGILELSPNSSIPKCLATTRMPHPYSLFQYTLISLSPKSSIPKQFSDRKMLHPYSVSFQYTLRVITMPHV